MRNANPVLRAGPPATAVRRVARSNEHAHAQPHHVCARLKLLMRMRKERGREDEILTRYMCLVQAHPAQSVRLFAHLRSALPNASHVSMRASKVDTFFDATAFFCFLGNNNNILLSHSYSPFLLTEHTMSTRAHHRWCGLQERKVELTVKPSSRRHRRKTTPTIK